jgi:hypothetical protein
LGFVSFFISIFIAWSVISLAWIWYRPAYLLVALISVISLIWCCTSTRSSRASQRASSCSALQTDYDNCLEANPNLASAWYAIFVCFAPSSSSFIASFAVRSSAALQKLRQCTAAAN